MRLTLRLFILATTLTLTMAHGPMAFAATTVVLEAESIFHGFGRSVDGTTWSANTSQDTVPPSTHLVYGYSQALGDGGARAAFRMKINTATAFSADLVANLDIYDSTANVVLATRPVHRNEFQSNTFADIEVPFGLQGRSGNTIWMRVWWGGNATLSVDKITIVADAFVAGRPTLINKSGSSTAHVESLVDQAIAGMSFGSSDYSRPNANDRFFVGKYYMAWIDQTGFYGKMNGLWLLNGQSGTNLNFIQFASGRPYNFLAIAENGDGQWMQNYAGAEHFEIPTIVPEANDNVQSGDPTKCVGDLCNWYSHNEASSVQGSHLPWWTACNQNRMSWAQVNTAVSGLDETNSFGVLYRAPLTKEGDNDGTHDGDACHMNMLFADGFRRPIYLNVGYIFYGDQPYLERLYAYENPVSNPASFGTSELGIWPVIHGIIITRTSGGITAKLDLRKNVYLHERPLWAPDPSTFPNPAGKLQPGLWHDIEPKGTEVGTPGNGDFTFYGVNQAFTLSSDTSNDPGKSIVMAHQGPFDNLDPGLCSCTVHGGLELGAGVLHPTLIPPVAPGTYSILARKKLIFPQGTDWFSETDGYKANAEYHITHYAPNGSLSALENATGTADGSSWKVDFNNHSAGHMIYGPYQVFGNSSFGTNNTNEAYALFRIAGHAAAPGTTATDALLTLEVHDATTSTTIASKTIVAGDFIHGVDVAREFVLPFDLHYGSVDRTSHSMETRVYWHDRSTHTVNDVAVLKSN
jgi:hypothetical protein